MRAVLPTLDLQKRWLCGAIIAACACGRPPAPVAPGPSIAADPAVHLRGMVEECDAMIVALNVYRACPNLEEGDRQGIDALVERAAKDFTAGRKAEPEANAQQAIAQACFRATRSVAAATERCQAGPPPRDAWNVDD